MIDLTDTPVATPAPAPLADPVANLAAAAEQPRTKRPRANFAKWRARGVVLLMAAGAVAGGVELVHAKDAAAQQLALDTVTLTAQPIPVEPTQQGQLSEVDVKAQQRVHTGDVLAKLTTTKTNASGNTVHSTVTVTAPSDGIVTDEPQPVGSTLAPGQALVHMYDPSTLTMVATVPLSELSHVSQGMTATLQADGLKREVHATVLRIVPTVQAGVPGLPSDKAEVVLQPKEKSLVAQLLPGLQFHGDLDTTSGKADAKGGVFVGH